jgi:hypothetical protein
VDATEDLSVRFDTVTDDPAVAVRANRRQRVDCALEAIEGVTLSAHDDFKRLVIFVLANFACRHTQFVRARGGSRRCLFAFANEIQSPIRPASSMPATTAALNLFRGNSSGLERGGKLSLVAITAGATLGVFLLPILKDIFGVPSVLGIVSAVSMLGLIVTFSLRREDTA